MILIAKTFRAIPFYEEELFYDELFRLWRQLLPLDAYHSVDTLHLQKRLLKRHTRQDM